MITVWWYDDDSNNNNNNNKEEEKKKKKNRKSCNAYFIKCICYLLLIERIMPMGSAVWTYLIFRDWSFNSEYKSCFSMLWILNQLKKPEQLV